MLQIRNLHAEINGTQILRGIDLDVKPGEVHAIMGPNGSGKSTFAHILAGREGYAVTEGTVFFDNQSLLELEPEERAGLGVFLAFQYPVEIPGVNNVYMLKAALNGVRAHRGEATLSATEFLALVKSRVKAVGLDETLLNSPVNEPRLAILDETDSGLDIDALKAVAKGVNELRNGDRAFVVVTHYQRLLDYIVPDYVHVLSNGRIVKSGGKELAIKLEERGYDWLKDENPE